MQKLQIAIDLGNFELKFKTPGQAPRAIRSARAKLTAGNRTKLKPNLVNPIVEVDGERWHLGYKAFDYNQVQQLTVEELKTDKLLLNVLACISPPADEFEVSLIISHPTPEFDGETIRQVLIGTHKYVHNSKAATIHFTDVEVVEESIGTFTFLQSYYSHLLKDSYTLLVDVGGGTVLTKLLNQDGDILDRQDFERLGAYYLANRLSADSRLYAKVKTQPDIGLILNGIAEGTHQYGRAGKISWADYLNEYLPDWLRTILHKCHSTYQDQMPNIGQFVFTGGSSLLLKPILGGEQMVVFSPELRFSNVIGMAEGFEPMLSVVGSEEAA